jgi:hypothetical protein
MTARLDHQSTPRKSTLYSSLPIPRTQIEGDETMPRKAKAAPAAEKNAPEAKVNKTAAIKAALKANPKKSNVEISELLMADGWDAKPTYISVVKSNMKKGKGKKKAAAVAPAAEAVPAVPKDAVSVALLQKAKKMIKDLGGVKAAKQAIDALAQLLD